MTNLHKAIVSMHRAMGDHHERCSKLLDGHARACDDGDIHKGTFRVLADEHKAMAAHHHVAAAELASSPEIDEFSGHDAHPTHAAGAAFTKSAPEEKIVLSTPAWQQELLGL